MKLQTIKLVISDDENYKKLKEDYVLITASKKFIYELKEVIEFEELIKFLDLNKGSYIKEDYDSVITNYEMIDIKDMFFKYQSKLFEKIIVSDEVYNAIVKMYGNPMSDRYILIGKERIDSWGIIDDDTLEIKSLSNYRRDQIVELYYA